jgi:hypothetical protein
MEPDANLEKLIAKEMATLEHFFDRIMSASCRVLE